MRDANSILKILYSLKIIAACTTVKGEGHNWQGHNWQGHNWRGAQKEILDAHQV